MSDLILPNIICFQKQKQLATLNNIRVLLKAVLTDLGACNFVHAKTSFRARCLHTRHRARNLSSPVLDPFFWKNEKKKRLEILSFYKSVLKIMIICYAVPEIWRVTGVTFFSHFRLFLTFYPLTTAFKIKIKKNEKEPAWRYHHFTHVYQTLGSDVWFLRYGLLRRTNWRTEKKTYKGKYPTLKLPQYVSSRNIILCGHKKCHEILAIFCCYLPY